MSELWSTLIPLGIGSAVVPIQIVVTILLLQAPVVPGRLPPGSPA